jgi:hypothetical protein
MQVGAISDSVVSALKQAAATTGSDFHYLLGTAMRESSLKPLAQSATSSATGLFQFVDQTWLGLIKTHGAKYGLSTMADAISVDGTGHYRVASDDDRKAILELRKNPQISALMAGEYTKSSAQSMQETLGRAVCGGELYAAHFLGPDAACKLIRANERAPETSAASLMPAAAAANKTVFFHADGSAKSVRDVYDWAMQQPGAAIPVRAEALTTAPATTSAALVQAANAQSTNIGAANIQALLESVMNWQPKADFFAPAATTPGSPPVSPLALTPGLLNLLSEG